MRVALRIPDTIQTWEDGELERISGLLEGSSVQLVQRDEDADRVVLLESNLFKSQHHIKQLRAMPQMDLSPWKLVCVNYEDTPAGFLPGAYSSLERFRFDRRMHISWPHLRMPNEYIGQYTNSPIEPSLLFSFSGSLSHKMRQELFDRYSAPHPDYLVRHIKRWYNHNEAEKRSYVEEILSSRFVLCPRGIASYSHRILETLALGRVPVVIADDWVPFSIPEQNYYVRIAQKDIQNIPAILGELDYEQLRQNAKAVYQKYFAGSVAYPKLIEALFSIPMANVFSRDFFESRWKSFSFYRLNGWGVEQRIGRRLKKAAKRVFKIS